MMDRASDLAIPCNILAVNNTPYKSGTLGRWKRLKTMYKARNDSLSCPLPSKRTQPVLDNVSKHRSSVHDTHRNRRTGRNKHGGSAA